ncbi:MAG: hypothetical protein WKF76_02265 [Nocardioidaceae bacterium]
MCLAADSAGVALTVDLHDPLTYARRTAEPDTVDPVTPPSPKDTPRRAPRSVDPLPPAGRGDVSRDPFSRHGGEVRI